MNILAFDTSTTVCSIALNYKNETKFLHDVAPMQQGRLILPLIDQLLTEFSIKLTDLDAIAFGAGPGSFTGTRLACSVAQGISFGANLPMISVSSLASMAQTVFMEKHHKNILIAVDARMEQIYCGAYQISSNNNVELLGNEMLNKPDEMDFNSLVGEWYGVGDGFQAYKATLEQKLGPKLINIMSEPFPIAKGLLALAETKFKNREWVDTSQALPIYLR